MIQQLRTNVVGVQLNSVKTEILEQVVCKSGLTNISIKQTSITSLHVKSLTKMAAAQLCLVDSMIIQSQFDEIAQHLQDFTLVNSANALS